MNEINPNDYENTVYTTEQMLEKMKQKLNNELYEKQKKQEEADRIAHIYKENNIPQLELNLKIKGEDKENENQIKLNLK